MFKRKSASAKGLSRALVGVVAALGLTLVPAAAQAAWYRVETDRFIVYGEGSEKAARDYATRLTVFDDILRRFNPAAKDRVAATKVQVYLVAGEGELRRVQPRLPPYTAGFYSAMNEGVFAIAIKSGGTLGADDVLFHEYAHHFMLENFPAAYPAWFVEGFAEYFMTAEILPRDGGVKVGGYNEGRAYSIFMQTWLPMDEVLSKTTGETRTDRMAAYYAQAWLLTHYMRSDPKRAEQLNQAVLAISAGEPPVQAFETATGMSMPDLTKALKGYRKLQIITIRDPAKTTPAVTVTALPKSADDCLLANLRLILSPTGRVDGEFLADVRRKAAKYPGDVLAERTLARAEFVMGDVAAGEAIMKRRLDAGTPDYEDLLLAGTGQLMAGMRDRPNREARYRAGRPLLAKAYQLDKNDFRALYAYELARSIEAGYPSDNDLNALLEARHLAPAVLETSLRAGVALLQKGRREDAAHVLAPVINNPHGGRSAASARALLNAPQPGQVEIAADDGPDEPAQPPPAKPAK